VKLALAAMHPDDNEARAVLFLGDADAYYVCAGIRAKRLLTDNGATFRSREFRAACSELAVKHNFTRFCRPQTNGNTERLISPRCEGRPTRTPPVESMPLASW